MRPALRRGRDVRAAPSKKRGTTLIEALIALAIMALMMVGILQMFSLALLTDFGSAGRTEMTYKAQQVVEILRWVTFLRMNKLTLPANTGIPATPTAGLVVNLPWAATEPGWGFWGPAGANAVEGENLPYQLSYSYQPGLTGAIPAWIITVTATPKLVTSGSGQKRFYLGSGSKNKRIDYVAQIPQ
jgi:Prokaryotic N-terminal methylation motif